MRERERRAAGARKGVTRSMPQRSRVERRAQAAPATPRAQAARPAPLRRGRPLVWWAAAAAVVASAGVAWWAVAGRPQAPLLGERIPDEGYEHVPVGTQVPYKAHPPASGPHYPQPAAAGVYPQGLPPGFWVHSLEHGYVVVLYRPPISQALLLQFREMVRDFPPSKFGNVKLVVAPYGEMLHPFAVLSWGWRMWMDAFDRGRVLDFYRQHVDRGREDIP